MTATSGLSTVAALATGDLIAVTDISDTSASAQGTSKKTTVVRSVRLA